MFKTVLVGVDGRDGGRDAIVLARQLAVGRARIVLANAYGGAANIGRGAGLTLTARKSAAEALLSQERKAASVSADAVTGRGKPAKVLHELAEREQVDLLVVGSSHRGQLGRLFVGDDTLAVLNGAPCAVAIAPRGYAASEQRLATIGVGHDGSPESETALEVVRSLAEHHGAAIHALSIVSLQNLPADQPEPMDWGEQTERVMRTERARLAEIENVTGDVLYGDPGEELAALSGQLDLLVVGSRAQGPLRRLLDGSTSSYLAQRSGCPLLVVPRVTGPAPSAPDAPSRRPRAKRAPAS